MPDAEWKLQHGVLLQSVVQASGYQTMACTCGCGTLKLLFVDGRGTVFASIGWKPDGWLREFIPRITRDCIEMTGDKPQ